VPFQSDRVAKKTREIARLFTATGKREQPLNGCTVR
jgi:hypothetical protein